MKCVYKLKCRDTTITEFYIGSSMNFKERKRHHKISSNNLNHKDYCIPLYMFINVNGGFDNWEFEVIKEYKFITKKELNINEQYWMDLLLPELNGQNAYGIDGRRKDLIKKKNKFIDKCPHCNRIMRHNNIKKHIRIHHVE